MGVSERAGQALRQLAQRPKLLQAFLQLDSGGRKLAALTAGPDATLRGRSLACLIRCASTSPAAASAILASGTHPTGYSRRVWFLRLCVF